MTTQAPNSRLFEDIQAALVDAYSKSGVPYDTHILPGPNDERTFLLTVNLDKVLADDEQLAVSLTEDADHDIMLGCDIRDTEGEVQFEYCFVAAASPTVMLALSMVHSYVDSLATMKEA